MHANNSPTMMYPVLVIAAPHGYRKNIVLMPAAKTAPKIAITIISPLVSTIAPCS